uniref:Uncharacterized protein n=1 Tax=Desulfovibrio sp. U5L TaxID=596152 RepID=I2Q5P2_9BACT
MHHFFACLLAVAVLCISSNGYAQPGLDRSTQFMGNCTAGSNVEQCDSREEICQRFVNAFSQPRASLAACRKACKKLGYRLPQRYASLRNCGNIITHGAALCEQECYRMYRKQ